MYRIFLQLASQGQRNTHREFHIADGLVQTSLIHSRSRSRLGIELPDIEYERSDIGAECNQIAQWHQKSASEASGEVDFGIGVVTPVDIEDSGSQARSHVGA